MIIVILIVSLATVKSYAEDTSTFGIRLIPNKMIENSSGVLEVYALYNGHVFPTQIQNMIFSSTDSAIVQADGVEDNSTSFITHIKISANNPGTANIVLAAPGFSSQEFPVTVYSDKAAPTSLLIKATPTTFSTSGPKAGYISVETVNSGGVPTPVSSDTPIQLSVSDSSIASLAKDSMVIKQGSYFATEEFAVTKPGNVQISASAPSMQPVSTSLKINNDAVPYTIQVYAYPPIVNVNKDAVSYVIVQLHDSAGNPIIAKNDIPVSVQIVNLADATSINTSGQSPFVQVNDALVIPKGSYWGYIPVEFTAGVNATYNVDISAKGYGISTIPASTTVTTSITSTTGTAVPGSTTSATGTKTSTSTTSASGATTTTSTTTTTGTTTSGTATATGTTTSTSTLTSICALTPIATSTSQVQIVAVSQNYVLDNKTPCFYPLPILTTGNSELIGVLALKDSSGYPALAKSDLPFQIDSSDASTVSIPDVKMGYGNQSALVFAQVGNAANPVTLNVVSSSPQQVMPIVASTSQATSGLVAGSLLSTVLSNTQFPLAIYAVNNGALGSFKNDFTALISPQETISPIQLTVTKNDPIFLTAEKLLKSGSQNIAITTPNYSSSFTVVGAASKPNDILLGYPDQIFSNDTSLFSIELLDDKQLPILADKDINVELVSSNDSVILPPSNINISKGSYYSNFDVIPKIPGSTTISAIANNLPLATYNVNVDSMSPTITVKSPKTVLPEETFFANITAQRYGKPLPDMNVNWKAVGASIQNFDRTTNQNGVASISLMPNSTGVISLNSVVSGSGFNPAEIKDLIKINSTQVVTNSTNTTSTSTPSGFKSFKINGIDPLPFAVIGTIAAGGILMKKKNIHLLKRNSVNTTNIKK
ncbi:MAG: hypothetical protein ACREA7_07225 [Nitrosotalea sp.]